MESQKNEASANETQDYESVDTKTVDVKERMTEEQANLIIDYMSSHSALAFNKSMGCNPKATKDKLFQSLKQLVDGAKGSPKTVEQIQSWWSRNKSLAKKYNGVRKTLLNSTGNPQQKIPKNSKYDKILGITGSSHKQGLEIIPEIGCDRQCAPTKRRLASTSCETLTGTVLFENYPSPILAKRKLNVTSTTNSSQRGYNTNFVNISTKIPAKVTLPKPTLPLQKASSTSKDPNSTVVRSVKPTTLPPISTANIQTKTGKVAGLTIKQEYLTKDNEEIGSSVILKKENSNFKQSFLNQMKNIAATCTPKTNFTQARSAMTMQALTEGSDSLRSLAQVYINASNRREKLMEDQNGIIREILEELKNKN